MGKISEALDILRQFHVPRKQQNERSALALLALLSLKENHSWKDSQKTLIRVHDMMAFIKENYKKTYAENSRETFRRQTLHQFEKEVGIVERNANDTLRPTNSPNTTWSVGDDALNLIKMYNTQEWDAKLAEFLNKIGRNIQEYNSRRSGQALSIKINGKKLDFSPGKHNELQISLLDTFKEHFCKNAKVLYT